MSATVWIPSAFRAYTEGSAELTVHAATVGEALAQLTELHPQLRRHLFADDGALRGFVNVFVRAGDVLVLTDPGSAIGDGDALLVLPNVAGGR